MAGRVEVAGVEAVAGALAERRRDVREDLANLGRRPAERAAGAGRVLDEQPRAAAPAPRQTGGALSSEERGQLGRAVDRIQAGNYAEGIALLEPIVARGPQAWEPWFWLGTARLGQGELNAADEALAQAIRRAPAQPQLWVQRAIAAQERGEHHRALEWLREARNLNPGAAEVHLNIGYSAEAVGLREEAVRAYRDFLRLTEGRESFSAQRNWVNRRLGVL